MYTIRYTSTKGQGMFAEKRIKEGTRILADDVLFSVADPTLDNGLEARISHSYRQLLQQQQDDYDSLHYPKHPKWNIAVSQFLANAFEIRTRTPGEVQPSGIFMKASRINHSCCPNAFFAWNPNLGQLTIHAMRNIPTDDEITIAYDFPFQSRDVRQEKLQEIYGFQCRCPACRLDNERGRLSEVHRRIMESLWWEIDQDKLPPRADDDKGYKRVQDFIELALLENLDGQFLSCMYERASMHEKARGSTDQALAFATLESKADWRLLGGDHPITIDSNRAVVELQLEQRAKALGVSE